jgi:hypothetical protein
MTLATQLLWAMQDRAGRVSARKPANFFFTVSRNQPPDNASIKIRRCGRRKDLRRLFIEV